METGVFRQAENEVHVLDSLARSSLDKIIYYADNMEFPSMFTDIQHTFVGIHDHLQVGIGVDDKNIKNILMKIMNR